MKRFAIKNEVFGFWVYSKNKKDMVMIEPTGEQYTITDEIMKATVLSNSDKLSKKNKKQLRKLGYAPEEIAADEWDDELGLQPPLEESALWTESKDTKPKDTETTKGAVNTKTWGGHYGYNRGAWDATALITEQMLAFEADGCKFYGTSERTVDETIVDGVIALVPALKSRDTKVKGTGVFKQLKYEVAYPNPNTLHMPITDMSVPPYSADFIQKVYDTVTKTCKSVAIYCSGGKGRTGTMLACMALCAKNIKWGKDGVVAPLATGNDVITHLRQYYHKDAVETYNQEVFVVELAKKLGYSVTPVKYHASASTAYGYYY